MSNQKHKNCEIQRFIKFRTYLDIFETKIQFTPSHLILKCQYDIVFSNPKIRHKYLILYKITSKNQRKVLHKKQLKSPVFFIGDKTTGIVNNN